MENLLATAAVIGGVRPDNQMAMHERNPYAPPENQEPSLSDSATFAEAKRLTYWPAVLMITQGTILTGLFTFAICADVYERGLRKMSSPENLIYLMFLFAPLLVMCGLKLKRLESRSMSYFGAVLSVVLFLPFGWLICIWTIVALNRSVVREAFGPRNLTR